MKLLITGAGGMLGQELVRTAQSYSIETIGLNHSELDICDQKQVLMAMVKYEPDIVVNCAGIVKGRDVKNEEYYWVNAQGSKLLSILCTDFNAKLIQISTDCVFDGKKPHNENDKPNAKDVYGESKAQGEIPEHLTLRMSFIGLGGGLVKWLMCQEGIVDGYVNYQWNGMTVNYACKNIIIAILRDLTGIVHVCGEDTNKYQVLCWLNETLGLGLEIIPVEQPYIDHRLRTIYDYKFNVPSLKKQIKETICDYSCYPCRA